MACQSVDIKFTLVPRAVVKAVSFDLSKQDEERFFYLSKLSSLFINSLTLLLDLLLVIS